MQKRKLGSTGISVSSIGLGTVKFGRNEGVKYPSAFELPSDAEICHLLDLAKELGINVLDTAPAYGESETRIGKLLTNREQWVISSKVGESFVDGVSKYDFSAKAIRKSVEESLRRLRTDYLDIVLVHSNGDDEKIINIDRAFDVLAELKQQGLIRAFGMSSKTLKGGLMTVDQADVVMVTYHPSYLDEYAVIVSAEKKGKGVLVKKALASGHQAKYLKQHLNFILKESGVSSVIVGTINPDHLRENVLAVK